MREIKFRMWDTKQKGWVMPPNHQIASSVPIVEAFDKVGKSPKILQLGEHTGRYVLMQFTGLHDKNGEDIFEGDIVKHPDYINLAIVWNNNEGQWQTSSGAGLNVRNDGNLEVIGNIYQNPELLKGEKI